MGRANLGLSAKHMGDSICFRSEILEQLGWGEGLTEDHYLRQKSILAGYKIAYEPRAIGRGEAPQTWSAAKVQRSRWIQGNQEVSHQFGGELLKYGITRRSLAALDAALDCFLPNYSSLVALAGALLGFQLLSILLLDITIAPVLLFAWAVVLAAAFVYPFLGLALERAPAKAYGALYSGPFFILWRTWTVLTVKLGLKKVSWVRTPHGQT